LSINFGKYYEYKGAQDSIIGIATRYRLHDWGFEPIQTGPKTHLASFTKGNRAFPGGKAAGVWHGLSTALSARVKYG